MSRHESTSSMAPGGKGTSDQKPPSTRSALHFSGPTSWHSSGNGTFRSVPAVRLRDFLEPAHLGRTVNRPTRTSQIKPRIRTSYHRLDSRRPRFWLPGIHDAWPSPPRGSPYHRDPPHQQRRRNRWRVSDRLLALAPPCERRPACERTGRDPNRERGDRLHGSRESTPRRRPRRQTRRTTS